MLKMANGEIQPNMIEPETDPESEDNELASQIPRILQSVTVW